jgi:putative lipoprotein (rSAM/lipoprotein system)
MAGLITLLCFSSCKSSYEYGSPYADYTVKGKVTDKLTGNPLKGIRVGYSPLFDGMDGDGTPPIFVPNASTLTNIEGEFKITSPNDYWRGTVVSVYVDDIDGEANGSYASDTLSVDFKNAPQIGKPDGLYEGEYTVTVHIELEESLYE